MTAAPVGLVLAGGDARRMQGGGAPGAAGVRKEAIEIGGATFLDRVVAAVARETSCVWVVTAPGRPLPPLGRHVEVVHDTTPGQGPLAAVRDGLQAIAAVGSGGGDERLVFVAGCDLPLLSSSVVRFLLDRAAASGADWTVPEIGGHRQVLCSVMRPRMADRVASWLAAGRRDPRGLFQAMHAEHPGRTCVVPAAACATVDPRLESFRDVDTPEDYAALRRQLTYGDRTGEAYTPPP